MRLRFAGEAAVPNRHAAPIAKVHVRAGVVRKIAVFDGRIVRIVVDDARPAVRHRRIGADAAGFENSQARHTRLPHVAGSNCRIRLVLQVDTVGVIRKSAVLDAVSVPDRAKIAEAAALHMRILQSAVRAVGKKHALVAVQRKTVRDDDVLTAADVNAVVRLLNVNIAQRRVLHENEVCAENAAAVSRYVLQRHISAPRDFQPHAAVRDVDVPHRQIIAFHGNQTARIRRNSQVVLSYEVVIRSAVDGAVRNLVRREVFGIFPGFTHARQHRFASALVAQRVTRDADADLTERAAANCAFLHAAQPNRRRGRAAFLVAQHKFTVLNRHRPAHIRNDAPFAHLKADVPQRHAVRRHADHRLETRRIQHSAVLALDSDCMVKDNRERLLLAVHARAQKNRVARGGRCNCFRERLEVPRAVYGNDVCFRLSKARAEPENHQQTDEPFSHDSIPLLMAIESKRLFMG